MVDWSVGAENRNYGIQRKLDARNLREFLAITLCLTMVAGSSCFYLWARSRIVALGYAEQQLRLTEQNQLRLRANLVMEEETVKQPKRIDLFARNELGMAPLHPAQLILPKFEERRPSGPTALAMAATPAGSNSSRKSAASN